MERLVSDEGSSIWDTLSPYSEDMSAAQFVIDRMIALGHNDAAFWGGYGDGNYTRPEAICKRALLVVRGTLDEEEDGGPDDN